MQILTDTHTHTVASTHAYSTVQEYFAMAKQRGLQMFASTDHAPTMPDGAHPWHFGNMKVLPRVVEGVAMLRGIESNILPAEAGVDIADAMLPYLDIAIASFHEPVIEPGSEAANTRAMIAAMATGKVQVLGHPGNPRYPVDIPAVVSAAAAYNVAIEINNSSFVHSRQGSSDNCVRFLEVVAEHDWKVVFGSDSHSAFSLGNVDVCLQKAQQVGFPMENVVSATPAKLLAFLAEHGKPVAQQLEPWLLELAR